MTIITGSEIDVFDKNGNFIARLGFDPNSTLKAEIMNEHYIQLNFNWDEYVKFDRGCYIVYNGIRYTIRREVKPKETSIIEYPYTLKFEAPEMLFADILYYYPFQGLKEVQWNLTGTPKQFIEIAIECINTHFKYTNEYDKWKVGDYINATETLIQFDSQNIFDSLTNVAETFGAEWWVNYADKTINIGYYSHGEPVILDRSYNLGELTISNESNEDMNTRLIAYGSTRNIQRNYRGTPPSGSFVDFISQKRLRMPESVGDYIDAIPNMQPIEIVETVKIFDEIYPRRIGTITSLRSENTNTFVIVRYSNGYINKKSGVLVDTGANVANFNYTGYLPANAEYTISNVYTSANVSAVSLYDSNKVFIQDYTPKSDVKFNPKTINANAAYIRISLNILKYPTVTVIGVALNTTQQNGSEKPFLIYFFKDSGLQFSTDYILPAETLKLQFVSGSLNGRVFELDFNDETQEFEIIADQTIPDVPIPNDILKPNIGDSYVLFNFDISLVDDQYVKDAEIELYEAAKAYLESIREDNSTYSCPIIPTWGASINFDMPLGQKVTIVSPIISGGVKESRVFGFEKSLGVNNGEFKQTYSVGDKPAYSRLKTIEKNVETNRQLSDMQFNEAMRIAQNGASSAQALNYLRIALENGTQVDGGLILTSTIRLGQMIGDNWIESAGINGIITENPNDPAIWAGGTLDQAINLANDPNATENVAGIVITHEGKIIANDAIIRGLIESSTDDTRITIDPNTKDMQFILNNEIAGRIYIAEDLGDNVVVYETKSNLASGENKSTFSPTSFQMWKGSDRVFRLGRFTPSTKKISIQGDLVNISDLGSDESVITKGDWYVDDSGFVKVKQ